MRTVVSSVTLWGFPQVGQRRTALLAAEIVELAVPDAPDERGHLLARADEDRTSRMTGVAQRDGSARKFGQLNTVSAGIACRALAPTCVDRY